MMEEWNDGRAEGLSGIWKSALKNTLLVNARKQCMSEPVVSFLIDIIKIIQNSTGEFTLLQ